MLGMKRPKTPKALLAQLIEQCDKDFRPVWRVDHWARVRAKFVIDELKAAGFEIRRIG